MGDAADQLRRRREARRNKILDGEGQRLAKIIGSDPDVLPVLAPRVQGAAEPGQHALTNEGHGDTSAHTPTLLTLHKPALAHAENTDALGTASQRAGPPKGNKPARALNLSRGWALLLGLLVAYFSANLGTGTIETATGDNVMTEIAYDALDSTAAVVWCMTYTLSLHVMFLLPVRRGPRIVPAPSASARCLILTTSYGIIV